MGEELAKSLQGLSEETVWKNAENNGGNCAALLLLTLSCCLLRLLLCLFGTWGVQRATPAARAQACPGEKRFSFHVSAAAAYSAGVPHGGFTSAFKDQAFQLHVSQVFLIFRLSTCKNSSSYA